MKRKITFEISAIIVIICTIIVMIPKKSIAYDATLNNPILAIYNEDTRIESIPSKDSKLYFDREVS